MSELSLLYGFFARFKDGLPLMSKAFSDYIKVHMQYMYIHMCIYQFIGGNYKTAGLQILFGSHMHVFNDLLLVKQPTLSS